MCLQFLGGLVFWSIFYYLPHLCFLKYKEIGYWDEKPAFEARRLAIDKIQSAVAKKSYNFQCLPKMSEYIRIKKHSDLFRQPCNV